MEHVSSSLDLPLSEMNMKMVSHVPNNFESQKFSLSKEQTRVVEPISSSPGFRNIMTPNNQVGRTNPIWASNHLGQNGANMLNGEKTSLSFKRKAEAGPLPNISISQSSLLPTKRPAHMGADANSFGFLQPSAPERKTAPTHSKSGSPGLQAQSLLNKKMVRNDSMLGKSGQQRGHSAKKQTTQIESASKSQRESSGAVRSKMRESLAAALALAFQNSGPNTKKEWSDTINTDKVPVDSQASESNSTAFDLVPGSEKSAVVGKDNDCQVISAELLHNGSTGDNGKIFPEFQYSSILPDDDVTFSDNFFAKDDLLQGNGLSWEFAFDMQLREGKEAQDAIKPQSMKQEDQRHKNRSVEANLTPDNLAYEIEAELFKLLGGVNKKYREKGRSLMFNLKDRSNPELRERVMSGEISPEKLCSMSAEELASKELSQWRMAKAEEFAQMVVLPDTEVDFRRLVKKTHKGEYQVEVERDDDIVLEVSGGISMLMQPLSTKDTKAQSPPKASTKDKETVAGQEISSENQDFSGSLIIPTDGTDLMQGMMVDEMKDAEFLAPVVSLDEFMESLNTEPPFENLAADAGLKTSFSPKENPKAVNNSRKRASESPRDASSKSADIVKKHGVDMPVEPLQSAAKLKVLPSTSSKVECIWEGKLQLDISSSIAVGGLFQSGEKTSATEWGPFLEIKGRVKLDAFEKFVQQLPMSRTRAVMILHFVLKDKSFENEYSYLSEAVDSYVADQRVGFAEPAAGVELYMCPPTSRVTDMLKKHMFKESSETNNSIENRLIGVLVWRRAQISNSISPNSSSHQKNNLKRQTFATPKRVQDSLNVNVHTSSRTPPPVFNSVPRSISRPEPEEDDDIPPGFGPAIDDDDLPEFNFSDNLNPSASKFPSQSLGVASKIPQRPVDQVRELIKKYGQIGTNPSNSNSFDKRNIGIEQWNNDDDDDIPEWRPQVPQQLPHHSYPVAHGHRPPLHLLPSNQHMAQIMAQPPWPHPGGWVQPPAPLHGARWPNH